MTTCERCGSDVQAKNSAGHFRDKCKSCVQTVADEETPHREECDDPDCLVCNSP